MQANYLGQVNVNGQMMNLFSFNDLMGTFNQAVDLGKQALDTANQLAPLVDEGWKAIDPNSYQQTGGVSTMLGMADNTINQVDQWGSFAGNTLQQYGLDWQQQQQLQQLGWFSDMKKGLRQVQKVIPQVQKVGNQAWKMIDSNSHAQYSGNINKGLDMASNIRFMNQQQQLLI